MALVAPHHKARGLAEAGFEDGDVELAGPRDGTAEGPVASGFIRARKPVA